MKISYPDLKEILSQHDKFSQCSVDMRRWLNIITTLVEYDVFSRKCIESNATSELPHSDVIFIFIRPFNLKAM